MAHGYVGMGPVETGSSAQAECCTARHIAQGRGPSRTVRSAHASHMAHVYLCFYGVEQRSNKRKKKNWRAECFPQKPPKAEKKNQPSSPASHSSMRTQPRHSDPPPPSACPCAPEPVRPAVHMCSCTRASVRPRAHAPMCPCARVPVYPCAVYPCAPESLCRLSVSTCVRVCTHACDACPVAYTAAYPV